MSTRCKFVCSSVTKRAQRVPDPTVPGNYRDGFVYDAVMHPVTGSSEENKSFFASTPSGSFNVTTIRDEVFVPGKAYYLDITEATE